MVRSTLLLIGAAILCASGSAAQSTAPGSPVVYRNEKAGIELRYPRSFTIWSETRGTSDCDLRLEVGYSDPDTLGTVDEVYRVSGADASRMLTRERGKAFSLVLSRKPVDEVASAQGFVKQEEVWYAAGQPLEDGSMLRAATMQGEGWFGLSTRMYVPVSTADSGFYTRAGEALLLFAVRPRDAVCTAYVFGQDYDLENAGRDFEAFVSSIRFRPHTTALAR